MDAEFDFELESDIVDQQCQTETEPPFSSEDDMPSRPISRLSFNRTMIDSPLFTEEETTALHTTISGTSRWTRGLLRTMAMMSVDKMGMDITTLASSSDDGLFDHSSPSLLSDLAGENFDYDRSNSNGDEDNARLELEFNYSSCEISEDEEDESSRSPSQHTQSTFEFPSFDTPPPTDCSSWTLRPKYSCLPSPLSTIYDPAKPYSFRHTPRRHVYRQHGHSRHSLLHLKWFWAIREEEWVARTARIRDSQAYDGLSIFRGVVPPPTLRFPGCRAFGLPDGSQSPQENPPQLPPMSIHPRRGDLLTLRDPYCMHIDRFFVGMPLWTMGKMLWMYDLHVATEARNRLLTGERKAKRLYGDTEDNSYEAEQSEEESVETSGSADSSDDSDTTLVESESEGDLSGYAVSSGYDILEDVGLVKTDQCIGNNNPSSRLAGSSFLLFKRPRNADTVSITLSAPGTPGQTQITTSSNSHSPSSDKIRPPWITCWYRRWDLLAELVRDNRHPLVEPHNPSAPPSSPSGKVNTPRFYIPDDENWSDVVDLDNDDDDMDVMIMSNPLYNKGSNCQAQV